MTDTASLRTRVATFETEPRSATDIYRVVHRIAYRDGRPNGGSGPGGFCGVVPLQQPALLPAASENSRFM
jgi:hypothetical protein